ncbi:DUF1279 superfamily [Paecilomyces lecythidis]|uniref:DUF1279 superfamily n=1 Tax=Paecilomyces lecythidis TaxID=3004212 RepID=A0ABR3X8U3_9EURO
MATFRPLLQRYTELFQRSKTTSSLLSRRVLSSNSTQLARRTTPTSSFSTCACSLRRSPQTVYRAGRQSSPFSRPSFSFRGRRAPRRGYSTNTKKPEEEPHSLSQRLKKLSREYGWSALGVYLLLSALDFPFCFAAVRLLGVDRIGHWEHVILETVKSTVKSVSPFGAGEKKEQEDAEAAAVKEATDATIDHGVTEAEKRNAEEGASIWTQLALAYAIHKSFIFLRVPLTAAVTPKVVKTLRRWGWDIGKRKPKNV